MSAGEACALVADRASRLSSGEEALESTSRGKGIKVGEEGSIEPARD